MRFQGGEVMTKEELFRLTLVHARLAARAVLALHAAGQGVVAGAGVV